MCPECGDVGVPIDPDWGWCQRCVPCFCGKGCGRSCEDRITEAEIAAARAARLQVLNAYRPTDWRDQVAAGHSEDPPIEAVHQHEWDYQRETVAGLRLIQGEATA